MLIICCSYKTIYVEALQNNTMCVCLVMTITCSDPNQSESLTNQYRSVKIYGILGNVQ